MVGYEKISTTIIETLLYRHYINLYKTKTNIMNGYFYEKQQIYQNTVN
jgi:hypothetical protein